MSPAPGCGRVALVHDWLVAQRGGENVLVELAALFPDAPIFTLVHAPGQVDARLERHRIVTSGIQRLPGGAARFRRYLPLFPAAVAAWDLRAFDTVISTSHCVAHAVRLRPGQRHLCYVHTPMRYLHDQMHHYLPGGPLGARLLPLARLAAAPLRAWEARAAQRPTRLLANSAYVAARIRRVWRRPAAVLHPPVDVAYFAAPAPPRRRHGLLAVAALVPYKRLELAIDAANAAAQPLLIVGEGPERAALGRRAGPTVRFCARLGRAALRDAYRGAEALLFCGVEDFGIAPVEAMAAGCPVVARRAGGLCETVVDGGPGATGRLLEAPRPEALLACVAELRAQRRAGGLRPAALAQHAMRFDRRGFAAAFVAHLEALPAVGAAAARP